MSTVACTEYMLFRSGAVKRYPPPRAADVKFNLKIVCA